MKLSYFDRVANFGDMLNPWLAPRLFGSALDEDDSRRLLFIGTVIERTAPPGCQEIIVGAGAGYKRGHHSLDRREIFCVRGRYTCELLEIGEEFAAIDPAILCPRYRPAAKETSHPLGFMPHHRTEQSAGPYLRQACEQLGLVYLSPLDGVETLLDAISGCDRLITEALHGAIVAEAYDVPWSPVVFSSHFMRRKWQDFCDSIGRNLRETEIHTNIAYDRPPRPVDLAKYALYRAGLGKDRYKYLPVRRPRGDLVDQIATKLRGVMQDDAGYVQGDKAAKAASTGRLDRAVDQFLAKYRA